MVNNNGIPIEINKRPIETVYEIKEDYKIPSFEEFMKDYQADEKVNDSYENEVASYGDIGAEKGYGPCKICWNKSEEWTDLYIKCPASGCPSSSERRSYWYHRYCGGYARISNRAKLRCSKCSSEGHMSKWNFRCSEHTGTTNESVDYDSFTKCLGLAMQNRDCGQVVKDLAIYISNHEEEWN